MQLAALCVLCFAAVFLAHPAAGGGQLPHSDAFSEVNITYTITTTDKIYEALDDARAKNFWRIALALPPDTLTITQPIRISTRTVLLGSDLSSDHGAPTSVLQCGPNGTGLLVLDGPELTLRGVQLQGCSRPGLVATPGSNATITITDSVFSSFTRQLVRKRGAWGLGLGTYHVFHYAPVLLPAPAYHTHAVHMRVLCISAAFYISNRYA